MLREESLSPSMGPLVSLPASLPMDISGTPTCPTAVLAGNISADMSPSGSSGLERARCYACTDLNLDNPDQPASLQRRQSVITPRSVSSSGGLVSAESPGRLWPRGRFRAVPLRVVFVVVLCVFAVGPAVAVWVVSWQAGQAALGGLQDLAMSSVEGVSDQLQDSLVTGVKASLEDFVERSEVAVDQLLYFTETSGVLSQSGQYPAATTDPLQEKVVFCLLKSNPWIFWVNISVFSNVYNRTGVLQSFIYCWLSFNYITQRVVPTLYMLTLSANTYLNASVSKDCLVNFTTGLPTICFNPSTHPLRWPNSDLPPDKPSCTWDNQISFLAFFGSPYTRLVCTLPFPDGRAVYTIVLSVTVYRMSSLLQSLVPTPADRLFLTYRTPDGVMVWASDGKFFSHSEINFDTNNPIVHPPPIQDFVLYSPVNSTDATIRAAGQWLLERDQSWAAIPKVNASL
eukprot:RCo017822